MKECGGGGKSDAGFITDPLESCLKKTDLFRELLLKQGAGGGYIRCCYHTIVA